MPEVEQAIGLLDGWALESVPAGDLAEAVATRPKVRAVVVAFVISSVPVGGYLARFAIKHFDWQTMFLIGGLIPLALFLVFGLLLLALACQRLFRARFVAAAGSITATPSGSRLVVNVRIAEPTSTLSPSASDLGSFSVTPFTAVGLTPHGWSTNFPSSARSSAWLRDTAGSRTRMWLAASRPIVSREFLTG